jgi:hypothetical protein
MIWSRIFGRRDEAVPVDPVWPIAEAGKLARPAALIADERDASGRFVSEHRRKVHEKCREQCAALGIAVPEVLR